MKDCIVIGCGIVGSTIALALRKLGRDVLVLDDNQPLAGTPPSGGHAKPSWFSGMAKTDYEPALQMLAATHGMSEENFLLRPSAGLAHAKVFRVDTDKLRANCPPTYGKVVRLTELDTLHPRVHWETSEGLVEERSKLLVVAAGVWCRDLLPEVFPGKTLTCKQGVSFRFPGILKSGSFIKPWSPYKQIVAHQQGPNEIWVGDGTAIYPENWPDSRNKVCQARCRAALGTNEQPLRSISGLRPYHAAKPCFCELVYPRVWAAAGSGKLGTIAGGYSAVKIANATK